LAHGGSSEDSSFGMMDTDEPEPCYFKRRDEDHIDDYFNIIQLISRFDVVYIKEDRDFKLPEESFCCLYQWPKNKEYDNSVMLHFAQGMYTTELNPRFIVVLRKTVPLGEFG